MVAVLSRLLSVRNPLVLGENERFFSSFLAFSGEFLTFLTLPLDSLTFCAAGAQMLTFLQILTE